MAIINCAECGKEISDKAKVCPHCGFPLKKAGNGFAVASLVLGIIALVYSIPVISTLFNGVPKSQIVPISIYIMLFAVLSLVFGTVSKKKGCRAIKNMVGIVLSTIALVVILMVIIVALVIL